MWRATFKKFFNKILTFKSLHFISALMFELSNEIILHGLKQNSGLNFISPITHIANKSFVLILLEYFDQTRLPPCGINYSFMTVREWGAISEYCLGPRGLIEGIPMRVANDGIRLRLGYFLQISFRFN